MNENNEMEQLRNNIKELIKKSVNYEKRKIENCCPWEVGSIKFGGHECMTNSDSYNDCIKCEHLYLEKFKNELESRFS